MVLLNVIDLLHPLAEVERKKHKLKRLVQSPNSYFMDVKCQGCFSIIIVFSHSHTVVFYGNCSVVLCQPTGGHVRLTESSSIGRKDKLTSQEVIDLELSTGIPMIYIAKAGKILGRGSPTCPRTVGVYTYMSNLARYRELLENKEERSSFSFVM
ncbi:hypothetical protein KP509_33G004200 [Ceratopteris richardii]|uniref:40S ribosomal protein S27 n=1 Tax=Ceratopteris richardii TaxID=49495 RepID=A0A8T2QLZ3_CERRI|nr:hypothetical protein KP509_33G004200 [Ceratopteris richardii]